MANNFCMSAICFSSDEVLSCASFTLFSRAVASSCKAVILSCNTFTLAISAFVPDASPADSFTTSLGPVAAGTDLSSAALLILPPADCEFASASSGAAVATIPANLLRYAFQLEVWTLISLAASPCEIAFKVSCEG